MSDFKIGIQLYTVRDALKSDFKGTLKKLSEIGYDGVEFAWEYGGMSPKELAGFLHTVGLQAAGLHTSIDDILNSKSARSRRRFFSAIFGPHYKLGFGIRRQNT